MNPQKEDIKDGISAVDVEAKPRGNHSWEKPRNQVGTENPVYIVLAAGTESRTPEEKGVERLPPLMPTPTAAIRANVSQGLVSLCYR